MFGMSVFKERKISSAINSLSFKFEFELISIFVSGWDLRGLHCYKFFNIRHSWEKAAELCRRSVSFVSALANIVSRTTLLRV